MTEPPNLEEQLRRWQLCEWLAGRLGIPGSTVTFERCKAVGLSDERALEAVKEAADWPAAVSREGQE